MTKSEQAEKDTNNQEDNVSSKWEKIQSESQDDDSGESLLNSGFIAGATDADTPALEQPDIGSLEHKLTEAEQKANDYWNDKMRLAAEMQNMTKRHEKDLAHGVKFANEKFAKALLPVMDSCVEGLKLEVDAGNDNAKAMHQGLELIYKQILSVFKQYHIEEIDPTNQAFNPELHEAMLAQPSDKPEGTVLEVIQKGYSLHERVLRPARVIVAKNQ